MLRIFLYFITHETTPLVVYKNHQSVVSITHNVYSLKTTSRNNSFRQQHIDQSASLLTNITYNLRSRHHNRQLIRKTVHISDSSFIVRMYKDCY